MDDHSEREGIGDACQVGEIPGQGQARATAFQRTLRIPEEPEGHRRMHSAAHAGIVPAVEEGQRAIRFLIVERHAFLAMSSGRFRVARPQRAGRHRVVRLEQERPIAQPFRHGQKLFGEGSGPVITPSSCRVQPETPQCLKELGGFADLLGQVTRAGVRSLDFRRGKSPCHLEGGAKREEHAQLLPPLFATRRQSPGELERLNALAPASWR